ncbi:MAG: lysylphosphatidylglycerol synthase transmembrane domain-containing protein [Verrucomicrobiota bacterium]|nr:lysylphosphatidylglycerol synthase transmembrane domain-containing protein [Verrucomicrobiota bacterium]
MKKKILAALQFALGIGLVALLTSGINKNSLLVEFNIPPSTVEEGAIYVLAHQERISKTAEPAPGKAAPDHRGAGFIVWRTISNETTLPCLHMAKSADGIPESGRLQRAAGKGPPMLEWNGRQVSRHGLRLLSGTFRRALRNWAPLVLGAGLFGVCLLLCVIRWNLLLRAEGLRLPFRRVVSVFFIGHFFNSFMPGAVGGDLVKACFVAKETHHRKTEAVATVFIDRIVGLLTIIGLTAVVMIVFLRFFLDHQSTRIALVFNAAILVGAAMFLLVVFRQDLFARWAFFRRIEERTRLGAIVSRVYRAFRLCLSHPGLLFKTTVLSLVNHIAFVVCACFLGAALKINLTFLDYLKVFPVINAVAAIPATPGGLGAREGMAIFLLGVLRVPATSAIALSLLLYASMLAWSLIGGMVYAAYLCAYGSGILPELDRLDDENDDIPATDKPK